MGERRGAHKVLVGKPDGQRPLGISRHRWEDNIKTDLQEVGYGGLDRIDLAQKVTGICECSNYPLRSIKYGEFL
jgi:hypothetical protein